MKFWTMVALEAEKKEDSSVNRTQVRSADRAGTGVAAMIAEPVCPAEGCRSVAAKRDSIGMALPSSDAMHIVRDRAFAHRK